MWLYEASEHVAGAGSGSGSDQCIYYSALTPRVPSVVGCSGCVLGYRSAAAAAGVVFYCG